MGEFPNRAQWWKPGQSGNPRGHSRSRRLTDALIALIEEKGASKPLVTMWLTEALKGNFAFFHELLERIEGSAYVIPHEPDEQRPRINIPGRVKMTKPKKKRKPKAKPHRNGQASGQKDGPGE